MMAIPTWMKSFPEGVRSVTCRCEETFYKLRAKVNEGCELTYYQSGETLKEVVHVNNVTDAKK